MILRSELVLLASLFSGSALAADTRSSDASRPRGVGPDFAKFYRDSEVFTCISHPSIKVPATRVNDDYCDCPDGSDEPGTAACSHLSPLSPSSNPPSSGSSSNSTLALPGFYCKNKGHMPSYLRFESVNDGKCDYELCCDGSDEYARVGGVKCPDRCADIGKEYRKHEDIRNKSFATAMKNKKAYIAQAETLRLEVESMVKDLESKIEAERKKVQQARENLLEVERRERFRVVKSTAGGSGRTGTLLGLAKGRVEELKLALQRTKTQRDSMLDRIAELEQVLSVLKTDYNPNFNDEGVKNAVRAWEDYAARETDDHWTEAEDRDLEALLQEDGPDNGVNWAEFESNDDDATSDVQALYQFSNYLPAGVRAWIDDKILAVRQVLVDNGVLAGKGTESTVSESKAVQDAKKTLEENEKGLSQLENDINNARSDLEKDYGPESIFRALKNKCIEKESGEYIYELCFLDRTKQKPKKGGSDTVMGNFEAFAIEFVDDELPLDGKGLGRGERIVMNYGNGQHCWNGPNRSTKVILGCSEKEEIWKISESEKCVYRMEVGTSAVCGFRQQPKDDGSAERKKDEL